MTAQLTANTITDEQIRELLADRYNPAFTGKFYQVKYACEVALQKEPMPTSAHRWRYDNARQICADAWNERASQQKEPT